ncbi:MAG: fibronectin type III domain-containing protein [Flavobacteriales bacterium]|nr:fibronectin type III domain-containing protein [Flavobacteriales bacterium]
MILSLTGFGQTPSESATVKLSAVTQSSPPRVTLSWAPVSGASTVTIYRKLRSATSWGSSIATPSASAGQYQDNGVSVGTYYEYKVKANGGSNGDGYISSGIDVPLEDYKGKILLLVDATLAPQLVSEIQQVESDLKADGWSVLRNDVSRTAAVTSVRAIVVGHYNADPTNMKAVYIIGHVPVPYSGNVAPDGHTSHQGAWPCDGYYGEMNGTWTDNSVSVQQSQNPYNYNVPGDGKFDQSDFPSSVELQVGRVDMYDMPAFSTSEVQLMRNYLNRAHSYKIKGWEPQVRAMIFDNLQWAGGILAASGWRSIVPLVGAANISAPYQYGPSFHSQMNGQSYLWTYSSGGGLQLNTDGVVTFNGADNIGTTQDFAAATSMGGVFNMSFGSYFGDWDNKNNYLKAPLARGEALTNVWSSIPAWYFQNMGLGDNIGYSTWLTMNNTSAYTPLTDGWQGTIGRSHLGLMGDPSVRMKMVKPPTNLVITNAGGNASFSWNAATETVLGYYIYKIEASGQIIKLTTSPITETSYVNASIPYTSGQEYMVRAVKRETNFSGTYMNLSLGAIASASGSPIADCLGVIGGSAVTGSPCNDGNACTTGDLWNASCQCVGTASGDTDNDGICNAQDNCPNIAGQIGSSCNDNNACTTNDVINSSCQCVGTPVPDSDGDGICNTVDNCPNVPGQIGSTCDDNDGCTTNDVLNSSCQCIGTPSGDSDNDGTCNAQDGCPNDANKTSPGSCGCGNLEPGAACNDNDSNTENDLIGANCTCAGTLIVLDCNGVANGPALPGTACNDNNANTGNDTWSANCQCVGQVIDCIGTIGGSALPGSACNDNNANTTNDTWSANCTCSGTPVVLDCNGVANGPALPGSACNDNNANTTNDTWSANCTCSGTPVVLDCNGVANGPALPGSACNDNNANTGNDTWSANCQCVGQLIDCEGTVGGLQMPGTACNDNNANTTNDVWSANCTCAGTPVVLDCNGVANGPALPGSACNDNNANTGNDTWNANCQCAGQLIDCEGTIGGSALPGTACNDNNANTGNDTWNANCQCAGQLIDCEGTIGGSAIPGTACNDNNANTGNDTWNANCQCVGQLIDCEGTIGGSALPGTACNDNNANTGNDIWNANCQCAGQLIDCEGTIGGSAIPGTACNDNNANTGNDVWNANCQCVGQLIDCEGTVGGSALPGTACNDNNANTANDTWSANCQCAGQLIDCEGTVGGSALPGTACNDNNANTGNDIWNANCQCAGQLIDCEGTIGGSALPGTACNDNNSNTGNDIWNANCQCAGQLIDCEGTIGGSALPGTACNDNNANTTNDTWSANCTCSGTPVVLIATVLRTDLLYPDQPATTTTRIPAMISGMQTASAQVN